MSAIGCVLGPKELIAIYFDFETDVKPRSSACSEACAALCVTSGSAPLFPATHHYSGLHGGTSQRFISNLNNRHLFFHNSPHSYLPNYVQLALEALNLQVVIFCPSRRWPHRKSILVTELHFRHVFTTRTYLRVWPRRPNLPDSSKETFPSTLWPASAT